MKSEKEKSINRLNLKKNIINNLKWIVLIICIILSIIISQSVYNNELIQLDVIGYSLISKYLIHSRLTPIVKVITNIGSASFLMVITIILFIIIKNKKIGLLISSNLIIVTILNQILKLILQRARPTDFRLINEVGYSFPSGHSMVNAAFYGYLIYLIYKCIKNKYFKWCLISFLSFLILAIGISRIYLGVHYASDVIGGILISICYLILFIEITNKLLKRSKK